MKKKILDFNKLALLKKKNPKLKIGLAHGVFDLFHFGHLKHLKVAKSKCDILVVSITGSRFIKKGPNRPYYNNDERIELLSSLDFVDYIYLSNEATAENIIKKIKPNIYFKGNEYKDKKNDVSGKILDEIKTLKKNKGKIIFTNEKKLSSSNLLNNFFLRNKNQIDAIDKIKKKYDLTKIKKVFEKISKLNVLVVGDIIIDRYYFCESLGKSPKEDLISVKNNKFETYGGGIIATANHISNFVKKTTLLTTIGESESNKSFIKFINKNIKKHIYNVKGYKTIEKNRFLETASKRKLFQNLTNDFIRVNSNLEKKLLNFLDKNIKSFDLVLINDFGHGLLTKKIRKLIEKKSNYLALNCQTNSSNNGYNFITKYKRANFITLDEPEARLSTQKRFADLKEISQILKKQINFNVCSITRGEKGCVVFEKKSKSIIHCPVLSEKVEDTLGAGDSFFAISSLFALIDKDPSLIGFIGNASGAIKVSYLGHRKYLDKVSLLSFIKSLMA